tara:strand:+ start:309 stop:710 length:402 start_codon:yes stop_codon:yes gene_type:complete
MGYRSDVVLAVAPEAASAFMTMCAKYPKALELCNNADTFRPGYENEGDWFMYWSSIKWYDDYDDVSPIQRFIEALESDDLTEYGEPECPKRPDGRDEGWGEYFKFIRIGENSDDMEDSGWGFDNIRFERLIRF